ncbi:GlxA family transcriptional regulator [Paraburkholderia guartelaensis]|uniref:GlxA family transcriptional regulator n=1 Tax=Paraburkholderia guartelaensis TaxID=2546446 RepID=A0ABU9S7B0_9BURK
MKNPTPTAEHGEEFTYDGHLPLINQRRKRVDTIRPGHLEGYEPYASAARHDRKLRVAFILLPRFTLLPLAGFLDSLRLAADIGDGSRPVACDWTIVAPSTDPTVASCGVEIRPWEQLGEPTDYDYVVVVGGLFPDRYGIKIDERIISYIRRCGALGVGLVGLCVGTYALALSGVLKGRQVCVHMYHEDDFRERFPDLSVRANALFAIDGHITTCAGGAAAIDVACHLIAKHLGPERALKILHHFLIDSARPASAAQLACADSKLGLADPRIRRALAIMEQFRETPISMPDLARRVGVSSRQLERIFYTEFKQTPSEYYRMARIRHGKWLMMNTNKPLKEIAIGCGFTDSSHFARYFKQEFGCSPQEMRLAAGKQAESPYIPDEVPA